MTDMVERVARALEKCADGFSSPVNFYVEPEARERWETANPDKFLPRDIDFSLESWGILARAAIEAMRGFSPVVRDSEGIVHELHGSPEAIWSLMIDAALEKQKPATRSGAAG